MRKKVKTSLSSFSRPSACINMYNLNIYTNNNHNNNLNIDAAKAFS